MGNNAKAQLFYGYCWPEEVGEEFPTTLDAWAETTLKAQGHTDPWESHPGGHAPEWMAENSAAIDAWYDAKDKLTENSAVDWDSHCASDSPMPFLFVKGTRRRVDWGDRMALHPGFDQIEPGWRGELDAFLESQGIEPPEGENQPGWWVTAYWG